MLTSMTRWRRPVSVSIAVIVVIVGLGIWGFAKPANERSDLEGRLAAAAATAGDGGQFGLAAVTDFPWNRVYAFEPYTSAEAITNKLGFDWAPLSRFESAIFGDLFMPNEGFSLLVFVDGENDVTGYRVVSPYEQRAVIVDTATLDLSRDAATFSVNGSDTDEGPTWVLTWAQKASVPSH